MKSEDIIKATRNSLNIYSFTAEALEKLITAIQSEHKCQTCEALARTVMMDQTYHDRATELLQRCENEMRYAGWDKFESDNSARNGVYEQVKNFLEKNT
jgi:DNA polymerase III delta prime subunit